MWRLLLLITFLLSTVDGMKRLISLPVSLTSRLDSTNFHRFPNQSFSFTTFTETDNPYNTHTDLNDLFLSQTASFISYSPEFTSIIGSHPELKLIERQQTTIPFAHEGGAFIPELDEVWFSADQLPEQNTDLYSVNVRTNEVELLDIHPPITTPNGVNYHRGLAYICSQGNKSIPAAIHAINPITGHSRVVVNSWFGYRLNSPNDVTFSTQPLGKQLMWFTDPQVAYMQGFANPPQYRSTVFRFDMLTDELRPVITDLVVPNGIAFNQQETRLYVSDTSPNDDIAIVYAYDLTADALPINRRVFSVSSMGIPDGIKVDGSNRVWIAEGDGINVRREDGTLLGVILSQNLSSKGLISNFALVDDTVMMLAQDSLWRLDLAVNVS